MPFGFTGDHGPTTDCGRRCCSDPCAALSRVGGIAAIVDPSPWHTPQRAKGVLGAPIRCEPHMVGRSKFEVGTPSRDPSRHPQLPTRALQARRLARCIRRTPVATLAKAAVSICIARAYCRIAPIRRRRVRNLPMRLVHTQSTPWRSQSLSLTAAIRCARR